MLCAPSDASPRSFAQLDHGVSVVGYGIGVPPGPSSTCSKIMYQSPCEKESGCFWCQLDKYHAPPKLPNRKLHFSSKPRVVAGTPPFARTSPAKTNLPPPLPPPTSIATPPSPGNSPAPPPQRAAAASAACSNRRARRTPAARTTRRSALTPPAHPAVRWRPDSGLSRTAGARIGAWTVMCTCRVTKTTSAASPPTPSSLRLASSAVSGE